MQPAHACLLPARASCSSLRPCTHACGMHACNMRIGALMERPRAARSVEPYMLFNGAYVSNRVALRRTAVIEATIGAPGLSIPIGLGTDGLPVGLQIQAQPGQRTARHPPWEPCAGRRAEQGCCSAPLHPGCGRPCPAQGLFEQPASSSGSPKNPMRCPCMAGCNCSSVMCRSSAPRNSPMSCPRVQAMTICCCRWARPSRRCFRRRRRLRHLHAPAASRLQVRRA